MPVNYRSVSFFLRCFCRRKILLALPDKIDGLLQSVGEFVEILLVKENFVAVEYDTAIVARLFAAFGNCQEIVSSACGVDIEKIGATTCLDDFRQYQIVGMVGLVALSGSDVSLHNPVVFVGFVLRI